jgi:L-fuconolactonase
MRIDSHQHFWRYNPVDYGWMSDKMSTLKQDRLPEDLKPLLIQSGIDGTVAVQARQIESETEFLLGLADQYPFILGVVGWLDMRAPQFTSQLEKCASHPKLKGLRHVVQDEADDQFMLHPEFLKGLSLLADFDLTYDLLLLPRHLPVAVEVVRKFPNQRFVLDHIAKPLIGARVLAPWQDDIRALAKFENVSCKVSGMVTETPWRDWQTADFKPYLDVVFDCFGVERLMFGSDWPVCTLSADYGQVVSIIQDYVQDLPVEAQDKIFGRNAAEFYRIDTL